jgi:hypothetical protein
MLYICLYARWRVLQINTFATKHITGCEWFYYHQFHVIMFVYICWYNCNFVCHTAVECSEVLRVWKEELSYWSLYRSKWNFNYSAELKHMHSRRSVFVRWLLQWISVGISCRKLRFCFACVCVCVCVYLCLCVCFPR